MSDPSAKQSNDFCYPFQRVKNRLLFSIDSNVILKSMRDNDDSFPNIEK